jgi:hypothetical protein
MRERVNKRKLRSQFILHHGLEFVKAVPNTLECGRVDGILKLAVVVIVRCRKVNE